MFSEMNWSKDEQLQLIQDQFGNVQNLQTSTIPQTSNFFVCEQYSELTLIEVAVIRFASI